MPERALASHVVVALDLGSEAPLRGLEQLVVPPGARVELVHVATAPDPALRAELVREAGRLQARLLAREVHELSVSGLLLYGPWPDALLAHVDEAGPSLVVLGPRLHGRWRDVVVPSPTERICAASSAPVLVSRRPDRAWSRAIYVVDAPAQLAAGDTGALSVLDDGLPDSIRLSLAIVIEGLRHALLRRGGVGEAEIASGEAADEDDARTALERLRRAADLRRPGDELVWHGPRTEVLAARTGEGMSELLVVRRRPLTGLARLLEGDPLRLLLATPGPDLLILPELAEAAQRGLPAVEAGTAHAPP